MEATVRKCLLAVVLLWGWAPAYPAAACPGCKTAVSNNAAAAEGPSPAGLARGSNWSIFAMLLILGAVAGGLIRTLIRVARQVDAANVRKATQSAPVAGAGPPAA